VRDIIVRTFKGAIKDFIFIFTQKPLPFFVTYGDEKKIIINAMSSAEIGVAGKWGRKRGK